MFRLPAASKWPAIFALVALLAWAGCSRTPSVPKQQTPQKIEFAGEWRVKGVEGESASLPLSLAVDAQGNVFVADAGANRVYTLSAQGHPLSSFSNSKLQRPTGITVGPDGRIYVASYASDLVILFDAQGKKLQEIRGGPKQTFEGPEGVTLDVDGNLYVVEFEAGRIQKFDPRGQFLKGWGKDGAKPGEFHYPVDASFGPDGLIYVADTHNRRVQKLTSQGDFLLAWGQPGTSPEMMDDVFGIAVTEKHVFLADGGNRRLQVWTLEGKHVLTYDLKDRLSGEVETPTDVAIAPNGELLVLDSAGARVLRFRLHL